MGTEMFLTTRGVVNRLVKKIHLVFVDADFAGGWYKATSNDAFNVLSTTGYVMNYVN